jgi:hypothetical protein
MHRRDLLLFFVYKTITFFHDSATHIRRRLLLSFLFTCPALRAQDAFFSGWVDPSDHAKGRLRNNMDNYRRTTCVRRGEIV